MSSLPSRPRGSGRALHDVPDRLDRLVTLGFLPQLFDEEMPAIAGHNPRRLMSVRMESWRHCMAEHPHGVVRVELLVKRINEILDDELLAGGWLELSEHVARAALVGVTDWTPSAACGGDTLGELLQLVRPRGGGRGLEAFYTPYHVCLLGAIVTGAPKPGQTGMDCSCGSGRMLLAAIELCREQYGPDATPNVLACDLDGEAVTVCTLNMTLAGVPPMSARVVPAQKTRAAAGARASTELA